MSPSFRGVRCQCCRCPKPRNGVRTCSSCMDAGCSIDCGNWHRAERCPRRLRNIRAIHSRWHGGTFEKPKKGSR